MSSPFRPQPPKKGAPVRANEIGATIRKAWRTIRGGPGILVKDTGDALTISLARRQGGGGGGGKPCQNWLLSTAPDLDDDLQLSITNPTTIGGIMPEFGSTPLDDAPPPLVTIPGGSNFYLVYFRFEWEPDVEEISAGNWVQTGTGTMIEIEVIVTAEGSPPTDVTGTINGTTGAVTANWEQHRRWCKVERQSGGELLIRQNELCGALEYAICYNRVRLGRV
jgi:hypothetical protein